MKAFNNCKDYKEYLEIIKEAMLSGINYYEENENGFLYLTEVENDKDKKKIIDIFQLIDSELSYQGAKSNEMKKKINYLLSIGIFEHNYKYIFDSLTSENLFTLIYGEYSKIDNNNLLYLPIFSNPVLLDTIRKDNREKEKLFGEKDYFFMIENHYKNNPFDISDTKLRNQFTNEIIDKINTNRLEIGVNNMIQYWESDEMNDIKRGIM